MPVQGESSSLTVLLTKYLALLPLASSPTVGPVKRLAQSIEEPGAYPRT